MPDFQITSPDGSKYQVTAPEGATEQDALKFVQTHRDTLSKLPTEVEHTVTGAGRSWQDLKQLGRGAMSGALGTPGALEEFGLSFVPGGDKEKRVFPTPSEVDKKLFGAAPQDERSASMRKVGEFIGGVAGPGAAAKGTKAAIGLAREIPGAVSGAAEVGSRLLPGATAKAQKTISEIAQPSDISTLGSKMYKDLSGRLNALTTKRSLEANRLKDEYFKAGAKAEGNVLNDYKTSLLDALQKTGRDLSKDQREFVKTLLDRMEGNPSIQAIETERRYLRNIASGKLEGYEAIDKRFAGAMADKLEGILRKRVPESGRFIDSYAERSKPIDMFETTLGQKVSRSAGDFLPDVPKFDPATIPAAAFKTRHSLGLLKQLVDDDRAVDMMASEYVATQLKDLGAKDARAWLTKQEKAGWLDEVPAVKQETEDYIGRLEKVSHTQDKAKKALYGAAAAGALGGLEATYYRLKHMVGM